MVNLSRIENPPTPVYPVNPTRPVKERHSPPQRTPQQDKDNPQDRDEGNPDRRHIDEFA